MTFTRILPAVRFVVLVMVATFCASGQAQTGNAPSPSSAPQFPDLFGTWLANQNLAECESATKCEGVWQFSNSANGRAYWNLASSTAALRVVKITENTVEILRFSDESDGIDAHYVGTLMKDGVIEGPVTWTKRNTSQHFEGHWYASLNSTALQARLGVKVPVLTPSAAPAQSGTSPAEQPASMQGTNPRRTMRLCSQFGCQTLTWVDGIYEARSDGNDTVTTKFSVVRWEPKAIELTGVVLHPNGDGFATGIFSGRLSASGTEIEGGTDSYRVGRLAGSIPYTLKWIASEPTAPYVSPPTSTLPTEMKLCFGQCFRLKLNGSHYEAFSTTDEHPKKVATYNVATFTKDYLYMNVVANNGDRAIAFASVEDNSVKAGVEAWLNTNDRATEVFSATWGDRVQESFKAEEGLHPQPCKNTGAAATPVKVAAETMQKQLIRRVAVTYPDKMYRIARIQGKIYLNAVISPCGTVTSATLSEDASQVGAPILGDSAIVAVKKWLYKPYLVNGHAVSVRTQILVTVSSDESDGAVTYPNGPAPANE